MATPPAKFESTADVTGEERLQLLIETGLLLHAERSFEGVAQAALDAGVALCGASAGLFAFQVPDGDGEATEAYRYSGQDASLLPAMAPEVGAPGIHAEGRSQPTQLRSQITARVRSRSNALLGEMLLGSRSPDQFGAECESMLATLAAQTASAMEALLLNETLSREIHLADIARERERGIERRLRHALDANLLGTWAWDAATGMLDLDERAGGIFGLPAHAPVSREVIRDTMVLPEDRTKMPANLAEVLARHGSYMAEYRVRHPDGDVRWVAVNGIPSDGNATGTPGGLIGTVQDISARRAQENALRQTEKLAATGRLAATIAHEINNPLEAVTNLIYLAKTDMSTPTSVREMLETADEELNRVSHLAQQTLGFYRDTSNPADVDLNTLLRAVVDLFARKLAGKRLTVELELDDDLAIVGLQGEIRQVVSNLLVNAIDASPSSGAAIRIRGRHRHRHDGCKGIAVMISDAGSGIPVPLRSKLFTPFVTTKENSGTGLGLWVTRGMVEKHGGSVCFRSRTEDPAGTCFRVFLPCRGKLQTNPSAAPAIPQ